MPINNLKKSIKQINQLQIQSQKSKLRSLMEDWNPSPLIERVSFKPLVNKFSEDELSLPINKVSYPIASPGVFNIKNI